MKARRVLELMVAGEKRVIAVEDAAACAMRWAFRCRRVCRRRFWSAVPDALLDVVRRFARTHGPFTTDDVAQRYRLARRQSVEAVLQRLVGMGRVVEGGFRPGGVNREWIDAEVLRTIRRKTLAKLAQGSRAGRAAHAGAAVHALAGSRAASARAGCAAGCDRKSAGRAAAGVAAGDGDSACAHRWATSLPIWTR